MKLTIDTDVLKKYDITLGQFVVLLASYYNLNYEKLMDELLYKDLAGKNVFKNFPPVISDNTKSIIAKILIESDDKLSECSINNFEKLAEKLQEEFPKGIKPGKTYPWRSTVEEIAQKLRILVVRHNFVFTEEEAIEAVRDYVASFKAPYTHMHTLKNFILYTRKNEEGDYEMESIFMTIIENNREKADEYEFLGCDIGDLEDAMG